ncbi:MAG: tRNA 2-thiouridine(34) synthase MnmA [Faecalibacterium sp.]|jgi:tRNA-specific 2-thiouridylase|nr:tRNA 2-thiouridine(34) synthase MnmA [Faecalibacterium sp.]
MAGEFLPGNGFDTYEVQDKVLVGMSGGVDSSVTVRILQEQGFAVTGAVIRFSPAHEKAVEQAKAAAAQLGIPCMVLDAQKLFEQNVIAPFCENYCCGKTPNPCVVCNPTVKFAALRTAADQLGIQYLATGHYARVEADEHGICHICRASSAARDQSYMLYRLGQDVLSRLILPLGEFEKDDVRDIARDLGLSCAEAPDSMEICFIPDGNYPAYIEARGLSGKAGHFLAPDGEDLGPHSGVLHYTVGQRKGLGIALGRPVFIQSILENGDIQLADAGDEFFSALTLEGFSTPDGAPLAAGRYAVKIRSAAKPAEADFDGAARLAFAEAVRAPAPGQSAVLYQGDTVVGGGFIAAAEK